MNHWSVSCSCYFVNRIRPSFTFTLGHFKPGASIIYFRIKIMCTRFEWIVECEFNVEGLASRAMMTSSNGSIVRVTGPLCGEFIGHRWRAAMMFSLISAWINDWVNNGEVSDLRRHCAHYNANAMICRNIGDNVWVPYVYATVRSVIKPQMLHSYVQ